MDGFNWAALTCYSLSVIFAVVMGFIYVLNVKLFHYHEWALGKRWEELGLKLQTLLAAFMKGIGGAIIALGIAIAAMIIFAFTSGETWSYYVIPAVSIIGWGVWLYLMLFIKAKTGAKTPVFVPFIGIALVIVGFVISLF